MTFFTLKVAHSSCEGVGTRLPPDASGKEMRIMLQRTYLQMAGRCLIADVLVYFPRRSIDGGAHSQNA